MFIHASNDYKCPICLSNSGIENGNTWIKQADIFFRDNLVSALISSKSICGNEGHVLIVPNKHYENIYELPEIVGHRIFEVSKKVAIALKSVRNCDGVTILQNNEPAGDQHAFHYHMHVIPRFNNDNLHTELWNAKKSAPKDRVEYANALKTFFEK